jgi:FMN phosphatase YigB (HAD superfamily)
LRGASIFTLAAWRCSSGWGTRRNSPIFYKQLSVDSVKAFNPAAKVYEHAEIELGIDPSEIWLVAAHNWDTSRAIFAGWNAAFVSRPGKKDGLMVSRKLLVMR